MVFVPHGLQTALHVLCVVMSVLVSTTFLVSWPLVRLPHSWGCLTRATASLALFVDQGSDAQSLADGLCWHVQEAGPPGGVAAGPQ